MQSQLVCAGCRNLLLYPSGARNICCAICRTMNQEMEQLVCGGCHILLMYPCGATSVRCSCCNTINLARAHVTCGQCRTTLMYQFGAPSVKCSICQYITNVGMTNMRLPIPVQVPNGSHKPEQPSTSSQTSHANYQTVVVENPMSVDERGKLVSNVVVGVTTEKK